MRAVAGPVALALGFLVAGCAASDQPGYCREPLGFRLGQGASSSIGSPYGIGPGIVVALAMSAFCVPTTTATAQANSAQAETAAQAEPPPQLGK